MSFAKDYKYVIDSIQKVDIIPWIMLNVRVSRKWRLGTINLRFGQSTDVTLILLVLVSFVLILSLLAEGIDNNTCDQIVENNSDETFGFYWLFPTDRFQEVEYFTDE